MTITPRPERMLETVYAAGRSTDVTGREAFGLYSGGVARIIRDPTSRGIRRGPGWWNSAG